MDTMGTPTKIEREKIGTWRQLKKERSTWQFDLYAIKLWPDLMKPTQHILEGISKTKLQQEYAAYLSKENIVMTIKSPYRIHILPFFEIYNSSNK